MSQHCALEKGTCLIIGGSSGLGSAIVRRLVSDGVRCHASRRSPVSLKEGEATDVSWSVADVLVPGDVDRVVAEATQALRRVDALVYCPGIAAVGPFSDLTPELWDEIMTVNVQGFALAVHALLPQWKASGSGVAVGLTSQAARKGQALIAAYTASKAALEGLIRALAVELAPTVRLNAVAPGVVVTPMIEEDFRCQAAFEGVTVAAVAGRTQKRIPLGRLQSARAVAAAVAFLISPDACDTTGHVLAVDGGMTA